MTDRAPRYVRADDVLTREGPFGVVVLAAAAAAPCTLTGTGTEVWAALAEPCDRTGLAAELAARFDADPEVVVRDVAPVVDELLRIGAIRPVAP
jgi:hypothetical protein